MEHAGAMQDEVSEPVKYSFWSLLGGAAWTVMTRGDIAYVGFLERHQKAPTWRHVKHLNTVVRRMKRKSCVFVTKKVPFPWQVTAFPDSAFRAQEPDCLATRAAVILITIADFFPKGGAAAVAEFYNSKNQ